MVFNLAYRLLGNYHVAEEAAQDTFVKAFNSLKSFRADSQFSTWLYKICYNTCITYKRKKSLVTLDINSDSEATLHAVQPQGLMEQSQRAEYLNQALGALTDEDVTIVTLFYIDENPTQEIAKIVGISEGNVRIKLHRARKRIKDELHLLLRNEVTTL
jgi:RNA polymerase sigma-70 factor (ECF subfamily)